MAEHLSLHGATVDLQQRRFRGPRGSGRLSTNEVALLRLLWEAEGHAVTRETLLIQGLGYRDGVQTRAVDNALRRLRHKLERDPAHPEHLETVHGVGYLLRRAEEQVHQVPGQGFFGRRPQLLRLRGACSSPGLLTVVGPGGVGKTRLLGEAVSSAAEAAFVELAACRSRSALLGAVAGALRVPLSPLGEEAGIAQLGRVLAARETPVLALDNFEQLIEPGTPVVQAWLERAPGLRVLVSSRRALGLPGEEVLELPPLGEAAAVALFVDRAGLVRPGFQPDEGELALLPALSARLDGLPLAIELAASRMGLLSVKGLSEQLERGLGVLRKGSGEGRQATMRGAIAWSWELLEEDCAGVLVACACFDGGFALADLEEVLGRQGALEALAELVAASLVRVVHDEGAEPRFSLLETVRDFALDKLAQREDASALRGRHWRHYLAGARAREGAAQLRGELDWHVHERANLEVAFQAACAEEPAEALELALVMDPLLRSRGPLQARMAVLEQALAVAEPAWVGHRAELLWRLADARRQGGRPHQALVAEALDCARSSGDRALVGRVLGSAGALEVGRGEYAAAVALLDEGVAIDKELGDPRAEGIASFNRGNALEKLGRGEEAERSYGQALRAAERAGDRVVQAAVHSGLGVLHFERGRLAEARRELDLALAGSPHPSHRLYFLSNLGHLEVQGGWYASARGRLEEVVHRAGEWGELHLVADGCSGLGLVHTGLGEAEAALDRLDQARRLYRELGREAFEGQADAYAGVTLLLDGRSRAAERRLRAGLSLLEETGAAARSTAACFLALQRLAAGDRQEAEALLARARGASDGSNEALPVLIALVADHLAGRAVGDRARAMGQRNHELRMALRLADPEAATRA